MLWTEDRIARLCLGSFSGFGCRSLRKLWRSFPSPQKAWTGSSHALLQAGIPQKAVERFCEWRKDCKPQRLVDQLAQEQISFVIPDDPEFPQTLRDSSDPPENLFVRGNLVDAPSVAIVGTRHLTTYGKRCVDMLVPELTRAGLIIVSGMALGIDGLVHEATVNAGGITIAILGTGIDEASLYPREHVALAHRILEHHGAIISEFPPGTGSRKEHFPMRNRLIASLTQATIVVEAARNSGSLITAKLALEENREVLAVPGPIWSDTSVGTNHLIKLGAKVCTNARDVLEVLTFDRPELIAQARALMPLDPHEQQLLKLLTEPKHIDELGRLLAIDSPTVSSRLAVLELKGLVKSIGGQMWIKGN
ncbi:DNA-protecting protein DprA [Candidatus Uhrbacteria bacterium]|nr:DNA-protecting protein DprA [Candidatus Uhrbacteria bacterium]